MSKPLYQHIETLWDYMQLKQSLTQAGCILVLGSNDVRVAAYAAQLYHQGLAPVMIFSGGRGRFTQDFTTSEAETFAQVAIDLGVPQQDILLETQSTNSGENIRFSAALIEQHGLQIQSVLLVQKPYMERRALATFQRQWPNSDVHASVTSTGSDFYDFCNEQLLMPEVIDALIGDFERIKHYPAKGFQAEQEIPDEVEEAYQALVSFYPRDEDALSCLLA